MARALEKLEKREPRLGDSRRPRCMCDGLLLDNDERVCESEAGKGADEAWGVWLSSSTSSTSAMLPLL